MKKALIILIVLAILVAGVFSLFYFVFTADHMKAWGDEALAEGNAERAVMWYEYAVDYEPENTEFVLALVEANLADNNFTQAERNLVNAIKTAPTVSLYVKLSEVYVMQDKLLDAQRMLDSISDPTIRSQIDAMRPSMPSVTPDGGEYHELICVSMESPDTVYYSTSDFYPTTASTPYLEPIALEAGTTRIRAIAVSDSGLVSPLFDASYLLLGVVQEITFASPELESLVRQMLYIPDAEPVMSNDLWEITELEIPVEVTDYSDLQYFENLNSLSIHGSVVDDYSFMSKLFQLETLDVSGSYISDASMKYISLLPALKHLNLSRCSRSDISELANAANLVTLDLSNNSIQDISALAGLSHLEVLNLETNAVTLLGSLSQMPALKELNISKNNLSSLDPLENSTELVKLIADDNQLMDVSVLLSMPKLEYLTAANNRIGDVSYLSVCTQMTYLDLSNNRLSSIDAMKEMLNLTYLDISNNSISELPELPVMHQLQHFYAAYNELTSIEVLAEQPLLAYVDVDYNPELEDITCLADCPMLVKVDAFGTKVSDIQVLLDMSVIVNYDPSAVVDSEDDD